MYYWLLFILIASINFWSFSWLDLKIYQYIHLIVLAYILFVVLKKCRVKIPDCIHCKEVFLMMVLPLLSVYSCYILHGQSITSSLIVYRMHLGWLLYFVLWYKKVTELTIYKVILFIAVGYSLLTIIQQVTYPFAPFGDRTLGTAQALYRGGEVERRFGFYRYALEGVSYAVISFILLIDQKMKSKYNCKQKFLISILIIGIIAAGNRQTIAATFISCCYLYFFYSKSKNRILILLVAITIMFTLYMYSDVLLGKLGNFSEDLEGGRAHSYLYYWINFVDNWMSFMMGNGVGHESSVYGNTKEYIGGKVVILSDIGILGTAYLWGIFYVLCYYTLCLKLFFNKHLDLGYKAVILSFLLPTWVASPLWEINGMLLQALLIYMCDRNIVKNKNIVLTYEKS